MAGKERDVKLGLVAADFNFDVTSLMLERARRHAEFLGVETMVVHVPGVFDMPAIVKRMLGRKDIDAVVLIGAVIKGSSFCTSPADSNSTLKPAFFCHS